MFFYNNTLSRSCLNIFFFSYRTPKKPKSKKISFVAGLQKSLHTEKKQQQVFEGTKETPITIDSTTDADEKRLKMEDPSVLLAPDEYAGQKRKRQNSTSEGGKRKKIIDEVRFVDLYYILFIWVELISVDNVPSGLAGCYQRYQGTGSTR